LTCIIFSATPPVKINWVFTCSNFSYMHYHLGTWTIGISGIS
jgi:hypothetical protein